jgi:hypothetical protein
MKTWTKRDSGWLTALALLVVHIPPLAISQA